MEEFEDRKDQEIKELEEWKIKEQTLIQDERIQIEQDKEEIAIEREKLS